MFPGGKILHRSFASVSPVFVALGLALCVAPASAARTRAESSETATTVKRQAETTQFARAEEQRERLNSKPSEKRTLSDYKQVVSSYRRVALITPRAPQVPDSLLAVAEVYTEMGDRFGRSYYQSAADSYQFLVREYPKSKYCQDAILRIAKLQRDRLGDAELAKKTYEDFLKRYPRSPRKREAQESLAELALLQNSEASSSALTAAANSAPAEPADDVARASAPMHSGHSGGRSVGRPDSRQVPRVRRIRAAADGEAARVTIDLEDSVQYTSRRIANPDRIFFDLHAARLTPEVARESIRVDGGLLTAVRVAQNDQGVVRVVLNVDGVKDYTASLTNNPTQLLINLYGNSGTAAVRAKARREEQADGEDTSASSNSAGKSVQNVAARDSSENPLPAPAGNSNSAISGSLAGGAPVTGRNVSSTAKNLKSKSAKAAASAKPELVQPSTAPLPTRDGQSTLTRALGLKISRIVIDAGHGGHDTGTIGPTGLMEKDLCLDVALRLGKIIQQRLPGADIVYTRSDDTFIPLEERTHIANEAKADMFISIHANSSQDTGARGIETYYLNLRGSAEAMAVASRENSLAQGSIHDLQDIVKQIARTEKIDESKEFAEDVQDSLSKRIQKSAKPVKNRGVRKAPFVVLIGADMPSILTEISFLSNPADEKMLKQPEHRQRVAEGIYQGVASYLQSLNSMGVNQTNNPPARRTDASASVESSGNRYPGRARGGPHWDGLRLVQRQQAFYARFIGRIP